MARNLAQAIAAVEAAECADLRGRLIRAERHIARIDQATDRRRRRVRYLFNKQKRLIAEQGVRIQWLKDGYGKEESVGDISTDRIHRQLRRLHDVLPRQADATLQERQRILGDIHALHAAAMCWLAEAD